MTDHAKQLGKLLAVATLVVSSGASATSPATPGTLNSAIDLASFYLALVSDAAAAVVDIEHAGEVNGKVWVDAIATNANGRQRCHVTLVKNTLSGLSGWAVETYSCDGPLPAPAPIQVLDPDAPPPPPSCALPPPPDNSAYPIPPAN